MDDKRKVDIKAENNKSEYKHIENKTEFNSIEEQELEDTTEYGEFIPSFYQWNTLDGQKKVVNRLQNITDSKKQK